MDPLPANPTGGSKVPPTYKPDKPFNKPIKTLNCGQWNPGGVGFRITGNFQNEAQFGEFPWMVAIMKWDSNENKNAYVCGASLIHPKVVMTAVHCINE